MALRNNWHETGRYISRARLGCTGRGRVTLLTHGGKRNENRFVTRGRGTRSPASAPFPRNRASWRINARIASREYRESRVSRVSAEGKFTAPTRVTFAYLLTILWVMQSLPPGGEGGIYVHGCKVCSAARVFPRRCTLHL